MWAPTSTDEREKLRSELDDKFMGHLTDDSTVSDVPDHGIPRPSWFKPGGPTLSEVSLIGAAGKGVMK